MKYLSKGRLRMNTVILNKRRYEWKKTNIDEIFNILAEVIKVMKGEIK